MLKVSLFVTGFAFLAGTFFHPGFQNSQYLLSLKTLSPFKHKVSTCGWIYREPKQEDPLKPLKQLQSVGSDISIILTQPWQD